MEIMKEDLSLLISINDAIATIKDTDDLFQTIFSKIHSFYGLSVIGISLLEKESNHLVFMIGKIRDDKKIIDSELWFQTFPTDSIPFELSLTNPKIAYIDSKHFYLMQPQKEGQGLFREVLEESNIDQFLFLPMKTGGETVGFLVFFFI